MRKNITVEFTNERIIPSGGLAVVGAILGKNDFVKRCNRMKVDCNHPQHQIKNGDIMLTYIGMQCMGKPSFETVHEMDDDPDFLKETIGICRQLTDEPLFFRLDSGNDSAENIGILMENGCHFIIKRNLRKEKKTGLRWQRNIPWISPIPGTEKPSTSEATGRGSLTGQKTARKSRQRSAWDMKSQNVQWTRTGGKTPQAQDGDR